VSQMYGLHVMNVKSKTVHYCWC